MPAQIRHLVFKKINNIENYEEEFKEILNTIFNINKKPPLGEKPKFIESLESLKNIDDLNKIDSLVLKTMGDLVYQADHINYNLDFLNLFNKLNKEYKITEEDLYDSLNILNDKNLIKFEKLYPIPASLIFIQPKGFFLYCNYYVKNFKIIYKDVMSFLLNNKPEFLSTIIKSLNYKKSIIYSIIFNFEDKGWVKITPLLNTYEIHIDEITVIGKREIKKNI